MQPSNYKQRETLHLLSLLRLWLAFEVEEMWKRCEGDYIVFSGLLQHVRAWGHQQAMQTLPSTPMPACSQGRPCYGTAALPWVRLLWKWLKDEKQLWEATLEPSLSLGIAFKLRAFAWALLPSPLLILAIAAWPPALTLDLPCHIRLAWHLWAAAWLTGSSIWFGNFFILSTKIRNKWSFWHEISLIPCTMALVSSYICWEYQKCYILVHCLPSAF